MGEPAEFSFDKLTVGQRLPPYTYRIDADTVAGYWRTQGHDRPPEGWAGTVPPLLLDTLHPLKKGMAMPEGVVHAREDIDWRCPVPVGVALEGRIQVEDKYLRKGKNFVVLAQEMVLPSGEVALHARKTMVWPG